ncbi:hypothetical protein PFISCL1PPCAC_27208, partial [Pristionchus fissidentatus]
LPPPLTPHPISDPSHCRHCLHPPMDAPTDDQMITAARILEEVQARRIGEGMSEMDLRTLINSALLAHQSSSTYHPTVPSPLSPHQSPSSTVSSSPSSFSPRRRSSVTKHSRVAHNELEKTRRANLRQCLERLKELVPAVPENAARNTTLALLTRGRDHLKELDDVLSECEKRKEAALARRKELLDNIDLLSKEDSVPSAFSVPSTCQTSARSSPFFSLEYSPSSKPLDTPPSFDLLSFFKTSLPPSTPTTPPSYKIDPILDGLIPISPICYPRPTVLPYTYDDLIRITYPQLNLTTIGSH